MRSRLPSPCAAFGPSTRRRVHSPSCATSPTVVSVTVVRGSTYASTPPPVPAHSSRCRLSADSARRTVPGRLRRNSPTVDTIPDRAAARDPSGAPYTLTATRQGHAQGEHVPDSDFDLVVLGGGSG